MISQAIDAWSNRYGRCIPVRDRMLEAAMTLRARTLIAIAGAASLLRTAAGSTSDVVASSGPSAQPPNGGQPTPC
jgi:hypothetical protein